MALKFDFEKNSTEMLSQRTNCSDLTSNQIVVNCVHCGESDSIDHTFIECHFTKSFTREVLQEGLNGVNRQPSNGQKINRQPSKTEYFCRQPSNERANISCQISQISLNDRDRLTKWGHQLVEQAINTPSGNGGDVITLIIHIVVISCMGWVGE